MSSSTEPPSNQDAFLRQFEKDRAAGDVRPVRAYMDRFPGMDEEIARLYVQLVEDVVPAPFAFDAGSGNEFGPYLIARELGRGGQGEVYLAEDTRLRRQVALKVLRHLGPGSEHVVLRFKREAEVAAKLAHPGICGVLDAGIISGTPFIAMQYVEGEPLSQKIRAAIASESPDLSTVVEYPDQGDDAVDVRDPAAPNDTSTPTSRADLMRVVEIIEKTARALHAAHEAGILHRDMKPGNVMINASGDPVILDFGLARDEASDLQTLTRTGDLMGTPAYMSPEQLARHSIRLDRRTDVWSLGVMLYECLTLKRPFDAPTREAVYQAIMTKDPPDLRRLNAAVPADLRTVLEKALEKDRDRRYETALDFAEELRRVRAYEPIHARQITRWIKLRRWAQRNPGVAVSAALAFIFLAAGLTVSLVLLNVARRESRSATAERERVLRQKALITATSESLASSLDRAQALRLATEARSLLSTQPELAFLAALEASDLSQELPVMDALQDIVKVLDGQLILQQDADFVSSLPVDEKVLIFSKARERIFIVDLSTGRAAPFDLGRGVVPVAVAASREGRVFTIVTATGELQCWDPLARKLVAEADCGRPDVWKLEVDATGSRVLAITKTTVALLWDLKARKLRTLEVSESPFVRILGGGFLPWDELLLVTSGTRGPPGELRGRLYQQTTGKPLSWYRPERPGGDRTLGVPRVVVDSRGHAVAIATRRSDAVCTLHDPRTGKLLRTVPTPREDPHARLCALDPGSSVSASGELEKAAGLGLGLRLVASGAKGSLSFYSLMAGKWELTRPGHEGLVRCVAFDGRRGRIMTTGEDGTVRIWGLGTPRIFSQMPRSRIVDPDGRVFVEGHEGSWHAHEVASRVKLWSSKRRPLFTTAGSRFLDGLTLRDARTGEAARPKLDLPRTTHVSAAAFSSSGGLLAILSRFSCEVRAGRSGTGTGAQVVNKTGEIAELHLLDVKSGKHLQTVPLDERKRPTLKEGQTLVTSAAIAMSSLQAPRRPDVAFTPDEQHVVIRHDGRLHVMDVRSRSIVNVVPKVWNLMETAAGHQALCVLDDLREVSVIDLVTGNTVSRVRSRDTMINDAAFDHDHATVVFCDNTGRIESFRAADGARVFSWQAHEEAATCLAIFSSRRLLASASRDGSLRLRNLDTGALLQVYDGIDKEVQRLRFTRDGKLLVTHHARGGVRLWPVDLRLAAQARRYRGLSLGERERLQLPSSPELVVSRLIDPTGLVRHERPLSGHTSRELSELLRQRYALLEPLEEWVDSPNHAEALRIARALRSITDGACASCLVTLGLACLHQREYEEALSALREAEALGRQPGSQERAMLLAVRAIALARSHKMNAARDAARQLAVIRKSGATKWDDTCESWHELVGRTLE